MRGFVLIPDTVNLRIDMPRLSERTHMSPQSGDAETHLFLAPGAFFFYHG